ncbi:unnamed protein product [Gordionus sp. m RMFG-2023]
MNSTPTLFDLCIAQIISYIKKIYYLRVDIITLEKKLSRNLNTLKSHQKSSNKKAKYKKATSICNVFDESFTLPTYSLTQNEKLNLIHYSSDILVSIPFTPKSNTSLEKFLFDYKISPLEMEYIQQTNYSGNTFLKSSNIKQPIFNEDYNIDPSLLLFLKYNKYFVMVKNDKNNYDWKLKHYNCEEIQQEIIKKIILLLGLEKAFISNWLYYMPSLNVNHAIINRLDNTKIPQECIEYFLRLLLFLPKLYQKEIEKFTINFKNLSKINFYKNTIRITDLTLHNQKISNDLLEAILTTPEFAFHLQRIDIFRCINKYEIYNHTNNKVDNLSANEFTPTIPHKHLAGQFDYKKHLPHIFTLLCSNNSKQTNSPISSKSLGLQVLNLGSLTSQRLDIVYELVFKNSSYLTNGGKYTKKNPKHKNYHKQSPLRFIDDTSHTNFQMESSCDVKHSNNGLRALIITDLIFTPLNLSDMDLYSPVYTPSFPIYTCAPLSSHASYSSSSIYSSESEEDTNYNESSFPTDDTFAPKCPLSSDLVNDTNMGNSTTNKVVIEISKKQKNKANLKKQKNDDNFSQNDLQKLSRKKSCTVRRLRRLLADCRSSLTYLEIMNCDYLTPRDYSILFEGFANLTHLILYNAFSEEALPPMCHLKNIEFLDISQSYEIDYENPQYMLDNILKSFPKLIGLDLSGTNLPGHIITESNADSTSRKRNSYLSGFKYYNDKLLFLGLLNTANNACTCPNIPAEKVTGDGDETQIFNSLEVYINRPEILQKSATDLFLLFRYSTIRDMDRALKNVLTLMNQYKGEKNVLIAASACLFYIVKTDLKKLTNPVSIRSIITHILECMESFPDEQNMIRNGLLTMFQFNIPEQILFATDRTVSILLKVLSNRIRKIQVPNIVFPDYPPSTFSVRRNVDDINVENNTTNLSPSVPNISFSVNPDNTFALGGQTDVGYREIEDFSYDNNTVTLTFEFDDFNDETFLDVEEREDFEVEETDMMERDMEGDVVMLPAASSNQSNIDAPDSLTNNFLQQPDNNYRIFNIVGSNNPSRLPTISNARLNTRSHYRHPVTRDDRSYNDMSNSLASERLPGLGNISEAEGMNERTEDVDEDDEWRYFSDIGSGSDNYEIEDDLEARIGSGNEENVANGDERNTRNVTRNIYYEEDDAATNEDRLDRLITRLSVCVLNSLVCALDSPGKLRIGAGLGTISVMLAICRNKLAKNVCDEVMEVAWSTLWNITDETPENCECFLKLRGLTTFTKCIRKFKDRPELYRNMLGLLGNISEVKGLRPWLMKDAYVQIFYELLYNFVDGIEIAYNSAGILSHLLSDGVQAWTISLPRDKILTRLPNTIHRWNLDSQRNINYRSLVPILGLLEHFETPQVQHWSVWALANLTRVYPERYCNLLESEKGIPLLKAIASDPRPYDHIKQLTNVILNNYDKYKNNSRNKNTPMLDNLVSVQNVETHSHQFQPVTSAHPLEIGYFQISTQPIIDFDPQEP